MTLSAIHAWLILSQHLVSIVHFSARSEYLPVNSITGVRRDCVAPVCAND
jgi:hypothetical protein